MCELGRNKERMLSQDESQAFWERDNGDQCISSCQEIPPYMYVSTLKYRFLRGRRSLFLVCSWNDFRIYFIEGEG